MDVYLLGQAGLLICTPTIRLLCDPWFVGSAHLGSWIPWPSSLDLVEQQLHWAQQATHIFLSHNHEDHAHRETLQRIGPKPMILGKFAHEGLRRFAHEHATSVTLLNDHEPLRLDDLMVQIHLEQPRYRTNSILVAESSDGRIVNANDCGLGPEILERIRAHGPTTLFLSTLNFVANGYPFPYLVGDEPDFHDRVQEVRNQVVDSFRRGMDALTPDLSIAFAGPVLFAHEMNNHLNALREARDWSAMVAELDGAAHPVVCARPLMKLQLARGSVRVDAPGTPCDVIVPPPQTAETPTPWSKEDDRALERFTADLTRLAEQQGAEVSTQLHLHLCATTHDVDWRQAYERRTLSFVANRSFCRAWVPQDDLEPHLAIYVATAHWRAFQAGEIDYDTLLLSYLIRCTRVPDAFDAALHNLLRFGSDPGTRAALIEEAQRPLIDLPKLLEVVDRGVTYKVAAHCPHEGAALDPLRVESINGEPCLRCPLHHWAFRLRDGACVKGDRAKRLAVFSTE